MQFCSKPVILLKCYTLGCFNCICNTPIIYYNQISGLISSFRLCVSWVKIWEYKLEESDNSSTKLWKRIVNCVDKIGCGGGGGFLELKNVGFCVGAECVLATKVLWTLWECQLLNRKLQDILMAEMALVYSSCGVMWELINGDWVLFTGLVGLQTWWRRSVPQNVAH